MEISKYHINEVRSNLILLSMPSRGIENYIFDSHQYKLIGGIESPYKYGLKGRLLWCSKIVVLACSNDIVYELELSVQYAIQL